MEYGGETRCPTELSVVFGEAFQEVLDSSEHQRIDCFLVFPGKVPELFGQSEGEQVVLGRQPPAQLILDPLLIFMVLAMGTVSVAAGMGDIGLFPALLIGTLDQHVRTMLLSAPGHGLQGLSMTRQDKFWVLIKKAILELVDDCGEQNHLTPPHCISKVLTSVLTVMRTLWPVLVVRWVYLEVVSMLTWPRIFCSSTRSTPASSIWVA